jgi:Tfp pilus assembly major pilin PilA
VSEKKADSGGGLSLRTLIISSVAAAAAAVIVPTFWERGSLIATAVTPVIVAIVSEALRRPAEVISTAAPKVARRTATGAALRREQPSGVGARGEGPEQLPGREETDGVSPEDPYGLRKSDRPRRRTALRIGVATGLLAAVIGAGVVTASELISGHSVTSSGRDTSLWGGRTHKSTKHEATATPTAGASATATPSASPKATQSATPSASASASPSASPSATASPRAGASPAPSASASATP